MATELTLVIPTFNESGNLRELLRRVDAALTGVDWEMIVVDDNSPDGTSVLAKEMSREDSRVRCLRRVNRRGLAGACIEGMLASSAPIVAVMDADLQHDERILPQMLAKLRSGCDLVVGSRHVEGGSADEGFSASRAAISRFATRLAKRALHADFSDLMSGFFMLRREIVEDCAPHLTPSGFKILADIVASAPKPLKVEEVGYMFRERLAGESKFDLKVGLDFLGLMLNKASGGRIPVRFIFFALVGASGVAIHMATVNAALADSRRDFRRGAEHRRHRGDDQQFLHQQRDHLSRRQAQGLWAAACAACSISMWSAPSARWPMSASPPGFTTSIRWSGSRPWPA